MLNKVLCFFLVVFIFAEAHAAEKYAVLIGINEYKSPRIQPLRYSEADATYLADMLFRYARYKPQNIRLLLGSEATYANIKKDIYWLGEIARPDDEVFFYFSGHGTRVEDIDGIEEDGMDEAFCPWECDLSNKASVLLDEEFGFWFTRVKTQNTILVLDCCYSGGAGGRTADKEGTKGVDMALPTSARGQKPLESNPYVQDLSPENKIVMSASDADQQSFENPELGHGVFTYYLGEALSGLGDKDKDQRIDTEELFDYCKTKTIEFASLLKKPQTPIKFGDLNVVLSEAEKQYCSLNYFDPVTKSVDLNVGAAYARPGDIFIVKRGGGSTGRGFELTDPEIMKLKITAVFDHYAEAKVLEEYFQNLSIKIEEYRDFYAEKQLTGALSIYTEPWSTVVLNGKEIGTTPLAVSGLAEGEYDLEFKLSVPDYPATVRKIIRIQPDKTTRISEVFAKNNQ